jgi:peptide/nickel transport system permease protein
VSRRVWGNLLPLLAVVALGLLGVAISTQPAGRLDPAQSWCSPSAARLLGCGEAGVDLLSTVSWGGLRAIALAAAVATSAFCIGVPAGVAAGLARGAAERAFERVCDLVQAFPSFLLAVAVLGAVRVPSRLHIAAVFALTAWAPFARLALAQTRVLREAAFVEAAVALGRGKLGVLWSHLVPNVLGVVAVQLGSTGASIIVSEAALSFVGLGPADGVSLGGVLDQGVASMLRAPHVLVVGAVATFATSCAMLVAGRAAAGDAARAERV